MSTFSVGCRMAALMLTVLPVSIHAQPPALGQTVTAETLAAIDFVVMPDGEGLPAGAGDARSGAALYLQHCQACHGASGINGINDRLAGGHGSLHTDTPVRTVGSYWPHATTVFDFIRRAMPYNTPGTLNNDEIYALTAYLLFINDVIDEDTRMNRDTLPQVQMPNGENFRWALVP